MNLVILGGNSDIGKALLVEARRRNYRVLVTTRGPAHSDTMPAIMSHVGQCDLLDEAAVGRLRQTAANLFPGPFAVVHSVGDFWHHRPLDETDIAIARGHMESHYLTLYHALHALLPLMVERGGGRVLAFSCNSVGYNYPEMAPFTAAKAAVETLIKCVANEYSVHSIQANAVALPTIRTAKVVDAKTLAEETDYVSPEELARLVLGDMLQLSPYVNGNAIKVFKPNSAFFRTSYFDRNPSGRDTPLPPVRQG
jgi:NAD(P)-dependent dehydrogenase (short-subunit alcohol dehydrogenase family)